jgi:hypothetical protein
VKRRRLFINALMAKSTFGTIVAGARPQRQAVGETGPVNEKPAVHCRCRDLADIYLFCACRICLLASGFRLSTAAD